MFVFAVSSQHGVCRQSECVLKPTQAPGSHRPPPTRRAETVKHLVDASCCVLISMDQFPHRSSEVTSVRVSKPPDVSEQLVTRPVPAGEHPGIIADQLPTLRLESLQMPNGITYMMTERHRLERRANSIGGCK